ncbi:MAG: leucine-rich repeat domain-containing protein [Chloroflexota bacterium]
MPFTKTLIRIALVVSLLSPSILYTDRASLAQPSFDCATVSEIPQPECQALVALYESTDGSRWTHKTGWLLSTTPCSWYGVACRNNSVTKLNLSQNRLIGVLPPEIEYLEMLSYLYLQRNRINELPPEIGELSELHVLNLHDNKLDGLPSAIGRLLSLHTLDLGNNRLQTLPSEIRDLSNLQSLDLSHNQFGHMPTEITELSDLEELSLSYNDLRTLPSEISRLENLEELDVSHNQLHELPPEIESLTEMNWLWLAHNELTQLPLELVKLSEIIILDVGHNHIIFTSGQVWAYLNKHDSDWAITQKPPSLQTVEPMPAQPIVTPTPSLPPIIDCNAIDEIPLIECQALKAIYENMDASNAVGVVNWFTTLFPCSWVGVTCQNGHVTKLILGNEHQGYGLQGMLPAQIGDLIHLTELDLRSNQITGIPPEIGNLSQLTTLRLDNNNTVRASSQTTSPAIAIPDELGELTSLEKLSLSDVGLTNLPSSIISLTSLVELDLSYNELTTLPDAFGNLDSLAELSLESNQLITMPQQLNDLDNLRILSIRDNKFNVELTWDLLKSLDLSEPYLSAIPDEIDELTKLDKLELEHNLWNTLPSTIVNLTILTELDISSNQLITVPSEITYIDVFKLEYEQILTGSLTPHTFSCDDSAPMDIPKRECEALVAIYRSTDGNDWTDNTGWLTTGNLCSWIGVKCDGDNVVKLELESNNLDGELPPEIKNLGELRYLRLNDNQIDSIPPEIGKLTKLETLYISDNKLTVIPPEIGKLVKLETLHFSSNQLMNIPREIKKLKTLEKLYLNNNKISEIPSEIGYLTNLNKLSLISNQLRSIPSEINTLNNLQVLSLTGNQLTTLPDEIEGLSNLEQLSLGQNQLRRLPEDVGDLFKLENMGLKNNLLTQLPSSIMNLSLESLTIDYNRLTITDENLRAYLDKLAVDWKQTQTVAPTNLHVTASSQDSITVEWTLIDYQEGEGHYRVHTKTDERMIKEEQTEDKTQNSYTISGLSPGVTYEISVLTYSESSNDQHNDLWSNPSNTITATTASLDAQEENDVCNKASSLTVDSLAQEHSFHAANDIDWIVFKTSGIGDYRVSMKILNDSLVEIDPEYGMTCEMLSVGASSTQSLPGTRFDIPVKEPTEQQVYLKLRPKNGGVFENPVRYHVSVQKIDNRSSVVSSTMHGQSPSTIPIMSPHNIFLPIISH